MQLRTVRTASKLTIPPPLKLAEFCRNVLLVTVFDPPPRKTPPPSPWAELKLNVLSSMVRLPFWE